MTVRREPPWKQNRLPPIVSIMLIASSKSRNARGASHQPANQLTWAAAWLLVMPICPDYLVGEFSPCVLRPLTIDLMVVLFDDFLDGDYGFTSIGSWCYSMGWVWNLRTKGCCMASGKWNVSRVSLQGFDVSYAIYLINYLKCVLMA